DYSIRHQAHDRRKVEIEVEVIHDGQAATLKGEGNGPIDAFVNALERAGWKHFRILDYSQKAVSTGSAADAVTFVQIQRVEDGAPFWGASLDANVELGSLLAVVSAFNRSH